ncbi:MAG: PEP-CTERM system histidine kinase PrsK [Geobacteraceae bacterium]|nr:PEP-CTERM system histidine kinase PrsK [Geobacteraceae bacterium]
MYEIILSAISAILLLSLAVLVVIRRRSLAGLAMAASALVLAAIEGVDRLLLMGWSGSAGASRLLIFPSSLLPSILLFYSLTFARNYLERPITPFWKAMLALSAAFPLSLLLFPVNSFFYAPDLYAERMLFLGGAGYWFYMGILIYCVLALMNLEATFSATSGRERYSIKFEVIGFAAVLTVLVFYYSQGLLYRTINMNLVSVRSGVFILSSILLGYSKLFRGNGVSIVVSRYIFYRSLTLLLVGMYLLFLGVMGEGMRYLGVSFSRNLVIFIAFVTGIAVFLVLFSEQLRRRVKVLINKHFYPHKHDYREQWLGFTGRLASCRSLDEVTSAVLATYRETFGLKGCSLYLLDSGGKRFVQVARQGVPDINAELPSDTPLVVYFLEKGRIFNTAHVEYEPTDTEKAFIDRMEVRLIAPLRSKEAVRGLVAMGEQLAVDEYIFEDYDLMKTFAQQSLLSIDNFSLADELAETREIAAVAKVSSFVVHDLKNLTSSLSMLLENARDYMDDPEFQRDMLDTIRNTLTRMNNLTQRLKMMPEGGLPSTAPVDIHLLAVEVAAEIGRSRKQPEVVLEGMPAVSMVNAEQIGNVIRNLLLNALEATGERGLVRVSTGSEDTMVFVRVEDSGCGMTDEFMARELFRPFRTTKKKGLGIGLYQCKQTVEAYGGVIEARSEVGVGAVFTVRLPKYNE